MRNGKIVATGGAIEETRTIHVPPAATQNPKNAVGFTDNVITTSLYTPQNFLFKNLFKQFQRAANCYFLLIAVLQLFKEISITDGIPTGAVPLICVLAVTMLKDAFEDWGRHKADSVENNRPACHVKGPSIRAEGQYMWKHVQVGDLIVVRNREFVPADLIMLGSSNPEGQAFVMTANLDGETNLKPRVLAKDLIDALPRDLQQAKSKVSPLKAIVECERPNKNLEHFDGTLQFHDNCILDKSEKVPIGVKQLLMRGVQLRNTDWVIGLVIYTGHQTKIMKNNSAPPTKISTMVKNINRETFAAFGSQMLFCLIASIAWVTCLSEPQAKNAQYIWNGGIPSTDKAALKFLTYLLIFNNYIPISLLVTMDFIRFFEKHMMQWDLDMYHPNTDTPAQARCSDLNEELGMVEHIFSDKTGTLTQNIMEFIACSVDGQSYDVPRLQPLPISEKNAGQLMDFFIHLALNHTVVTDGVDAAGHIVYSAASPDEGALVQAAADFGVEFISRPSQTTVELKVHGEKQVYEILHNFEFTSSRQRSSVVVRRQTPPDKRILLYTKGADSKIRGLLKNSKTPKVNVCTQHTDSFASEGLRTLFISQRVLADSVYKSWLSKFKKASCSMQNRDQKIDTLTSALETELELVGCSAIEDKLQVDVTTSIAALRSSGIKVWVLTGDKVATAVEIGYNCSLLSRENMKVLRLVQGDGAWPSVNPGGLPEVSAICDAIRDRTAEATTQLQPGQQVGLVCDTGFLSAVEKYEVSAQFLELCSNCQAILCCRVSPDQKGRVVQMVKETKSRPTTLAIGDGANDVNMIQKAHIGIGISGLEGLQAVNASDYAIAQFRFLVNLLLVHGRFSLRRSGIMARYMYYKNAIMVLPQFFFGMFSLFSGQPLYYDGLYQAYNMLFTAFPVIWFGVMDRDVEKRQALAHPKLYMEGLNSEFYSQKSFWVSMVIAIFNGYIITLFAAQTFSSGVLGVNTLDLWQIGAAVNFAVVLGAHARLLMDVRCIHRSFMVLVIVSIILWWIFYAAFSASAIYPVMYWNIRGFAAYVPQFIDTWLYWLLCTVTSLIIALTIEAYRVLYNPSFSDICREWVHLGHEKKNSKLTSEQQKLQSSSDPGSSKVPARVVQTQKHKALEMVPVSSNSPSLVQLSPHKPLPAMKQV